MKGRKDDRCTPYRFTLGISIQRRWKRVHITIASLQTPSTPSPPHLFLCQLKKNERKSLFSDADHYLDHPPQSLRACIVPTIDWPSLLGKGLGEGRGGSKVQRPRKAHYTQTMFLLKNNTRSCKKKKNSSPPPLFQSSHNNNIRRLYELDCLVFGVNVGW